MANSIWAAIKRVDGLIVIPRRYRDGFCLFIIVVVTALSWIPRRSGPIDLRWDAGVYYILGTSLAEGKGYRLLNEPGQIKAIQYPPLLPAIVAIHQKVLASSDPVVVGAWLRVTFFVFSILSAVGCFLLARLFVDRRYALPLALTCVVSYEIFFVSTLCFAELPFELLAVYAVYFHYKPKQDRLARFGTGATAVATYLVRSVGIALLAAWVADALFRKQFRTAAMRAFIAVVPVLLWQGYIRSVESEPTYKTPFYSYQRAPWMFYNVSYATNLALLSPFQPEQGKASVSALTGRFLGNVAAMPYNIGEALLIPARFLKGLMQQVHNRLGIDLIPWSAVNGLLTLLGLGAIAGILVQIRMRLWFLALSLAMTLAAVCATPWPGQVLRYLSPTMPFLVLALFQGVDQAGRWVARRSSWAGAFIHGWVGTGLALLVLGGASLSCRTALKNFLDPAIYVQKDGTRKSFNLLHSPPEFAAMDLALEWLSRNAQPRSVVAVSMPHWVYLKTRLSTVMPPIDNNPVKAGEMLDSVPVSYLVLEHMFMEHDFNETFPALVEKNPGKWHLVYSKSGVAIFQRVES